jgi:hypothetical protein
LGAENSVTLYGKTNSLHGVSSVSITSSPLRINYSQKESLNITQLTVQEEVPNKSATFCFQLQLEPALSASVKFFLQEESEYAWTQLAVKNSSTETNYSKSGYYTNTWNISGIVNDKVYRLRATATQSDRKTNSAVLEKISFARLSFTGTTLSQAKLIYSPYRGDSAGILMINLPKGTQAEIYSISGKKLCHLTQADDFGMLTWKVTDDSGKKVSPGIYLVMLSLGGEKKFLKAIVM